MQRPASVPELLTARLRLRGWREEDVEPLAAINADPRVGEWLGGTRDLEQTRDAIARWMDHWRERGFGLWGVEELASGSLIGRIGLMHWDDWPAGDHDAEVGWTLAPSAWGRGLATEGAREALRFGFAERDLQHIISITLPTNLRSQRVMTKLGLTRRGEVDWRGFHQVWYAIEREEWERIR